jgi:hypothetical protein
VAESLDKQIHDIVYDHRAEADKLLEERRSRGDDTTAEAENLIGLTAWLNGLEAAIAKVAVEVENLAADLKKRP